MANLIRLSLDKFKNMFQMNRLIVSLTFLSLILLLFIINTYGGNSLIQYSLSNLSESEVDLSSNSSNLIPPVAKYKNLRTAIPCSKTNDLKPACYDPYVRLFICILIILMIPNPVSAAPIISDKDLNKVKVVYTLNSVGQSVLLYYYQYVKPFASNKNIKDYLIQDLGWSQTRFKKKFDKTQIFTIENSPNNGEEYDISLLLTCIRALSEITEPGSQGKWLDVNELEGKCKILKDMRNNAFHSISGIDIPEMRNQIDAIEKLLIDILDSLKGRYPSETRVVDDMKIDINNKVADILVHPLSTVERRNCRLQLNMQHLKSKIPGYKNKCKNWGKVGILEFLIGSEKIHEIKMLYTKAVVEKSNYRDKHVKVKCTDIFKSANSSILLIDSEAGGGKTTIFRFGIWDWSEGGSIMNTDDYDLIFPMLFRNPHIKCVKDLLKHLFPEASRDIDIEDIMDLIADPSLKVVFFCDGYDEKNENSRQLFSEICELKRKYPHINIVCTSRPESVREFHLSVGKDHSIEHVKLLGVHESDRPEFLRKYHDEIIKAGNSTQNTVDLINFYLGQSARHKELYRLPINLVILAHIWGVDPQQAKNIKSAAGLYNAILDILNRKLIERIIYSHPEVMNKLDGDLDELQSLINGFKDIIYEESLAAIMSDRMYINAKGVNRLRDYCKSNGLPFIQLKGAFLLTKVEWENVNDLKEVLEVAHKGFLDYFAAMCIAVKLGHYIAKFKLMKLFSSEYRRANNIKKIIMDSYNISGDKLDIGKFQNIIQLLGGVLALKDDTLLEKYGKDIIDLLIETGVSNNSQWFDTYGVLNINNKAAVKFGKLIAPHLNLVNFIIKDSDIDILSVLLKHIDILNMKVTLDISSDAIHKELPSLYDLLVQNECKLSIQSIKINDETFEFWNRVLTQTKDIIIKDVTLDISNSASHNDFHSLLQFLSKSKCKVTMKNIDNEPLELWKCVLTQSDQINFQNVTLDNSTHNNLKEFPALMKVLSDSKSKVAITMINDVNFDFWNRVLTQSNQIDIQNLTLDVSLIDLPFLNKYQNITTCKLRPFWRGLTGAAPDMSGCDVDTLYTAVLTTSSLPTTLRYLRLGLLTDDATGDVRDPGIGNITNRCPQLDDLGVHLRAGSGAVGRLPRLPRVQYTRLYLSQLKPENLQWAVDAVAALQPAGAEYGQLILPSCGLPLSQLRQLGVELQRAGVKINVRLVISSQHTEAEEDTLGREVWTTLNWGLWWVQNDSALSMW